MDKIKTFLIIATFFLIITSAILIWMLMNPKNSDAWFNENPVPSPVCGEGEHIGNPHCSPSPSPKASSSPKVSPSVSPSPTPCIVWEGEFPMPCASTSPSPSPSPSASPSEQPTPTSGNTGQGAGNPGPTSDGLGCGSHDCSVHPVVVPSGAPNTGRAEE